VAAGLERAEGTLAGSGLILAKPLTRDEARQIAANFAKLSGAVEKALKLAS
jgi:hypothetical protein